MLLDAGILKAGTNVLRVTYMGKTTEASLMPDGEIMYAARGRRQPFASPSKFSTFAKQLSKTSLKVKTIELIAMVGAHHWVSLLLHQVQVQTHVLQVKS